MKRSKVVVLLLAFMAIIAPITLTLIYTHDNLSGAIPISSIKSALTPIGTNVTLKGKIIDILVLSLSANDQVVSISDGSGFIGFFWTKTLLQINWTILVGGTVDTNHTLRPVSEVELVLLFS